MSNKMDCRSGQAFSNEYSIAKIGVITADNELAKVFNFLNLIHHTDLTVIKIDRPASEARCSALTLPMLDDRF